MKKEILSRLTESLQEAFDKRQDMPHQFVVAYYRMDNNELIGYHLSTFCQVTPDILEAKRYADENPYPQLKVIAKNIKYTLDEEPEEDSIFSSITKEVRKDFGGLKSNEIWLDAIYLEEGTPKQSFKYTVLDIGTSTESNSSDN